MKLAMKIASKSYTASSRKEAYLKGMKDLAKYIVMDNISVKVEKVPGQENSLVFTLFTNIDAGHEINNFCKMCREIHTAFFINEDYNCSRCNLRTFTSREEEKLRISKGFYKRKLKDKKE